MTHAYKQDSSSHIVFTTVFTTSQSTQSQGMKHLSSWKRHVVPKLLACQKHVHVLHPTAKSLFFFIKFWWKSILIGWNSSISCIQRPNGGKPPAFRQKLTEHQKPQTEQPSHDHLTSPVDSSAHRRPAGKVKGFASWVRNPFLETQKSTMIQGFFSKDFQRGITAGGSWSASLSNNCMMTTPVQSTQIYPIWIKLQTILRVKKDLGYSPGALAKAAFTKSLPLK